MSELSGRAHSLFEAARSTSHPTPEDAARVRAALQARLAAGPSTAPPPASAASASVAAKIAAGTALLGLAIVGVALIGHGDGSSAPGNAKTPAAAPALPLEHAAVPMAVAPAPPTPAASFEPPAVIPEIAAEPVVEQPRLRRPDRRVATTPPASPAPTQQAEDASGDDLDAELELVRAARQALRLDPRRALALSSEHADRFPQGMFRQEASAVGVLARCALGRDASSQRQAATFVDRYPSSNYARRIRSACALPDDQTDGTEVDRTPGAHMPTGDN